MAQHVGESEQSRVYSARDAAAAAPPCVTPCIQAPSPLPDATASHLALARVIQSHGRHRRPILPPTLRHTWISVTFIQISQGGADALAK